MENQRDLKKLGQKLAYLLRHDKDYNFRDGGWRYSSELTANHGFTLTDLIDIVNLDDKRRFEWEDVVTYSWIRAVQGHSVNVDLHYKSATPPDYLYHGTSEKVLKQILSEGLKKMNRLYVHLSPDPKTAYSIGGRKKKKGTITDVVVLRINAFKMWSDLSHNYTFFEAKNGIWLTDEVPPEYLELYKS